MEYIMNKIGLSLHGSSTLQKWWPKNAVLAANFRTGQYMINGTNIPQETFLNISRNSAGFVQDQAMCWKKVPNHKPRRSNMGLFVEPAQTAFPQNSELNGAVVGIIGNGGALPTGWQSYALDTLEILSIGVEFGLPYIEIRHNHPEFI